MHAKKKNIMHVKRKTEATPTVILPMRGKD